MEKKRSVQSWSREQRVGIVFKVSRIVHSKGVGGQTWVKIGSRKYSIVPIKRTVFFACGVIIFPVIRYV